MPPTWDRHWRVLENFHFVLFTPGFSERWCEPRCEMDPEPGDRMPNGGDFNANGVRFPGGKHAVVLETVKNVARDTSRSCKNATFCGVLSTSSLESDSAGGSCIHW